MKKLMILIILASLLLVGCSEEVPAEAGLFAMDTLMNVKIWGDPTLLDSVLEEIHSLDSQLSAQSETSLIWQANMFGSVELNEDVLSLVQDALTLSKETNGAFDPTVYPLIELWGFPTDVLHIPSQEELDAALSTVGTHHIHLNGSTLTLDEGTKLDFGAIAKGYAAQRAIRLLEDNGVKGAILNLGGNVQTLGTKPDGKPWVVGIADPSNPSVSIATLQFTGSKALVTSGSYQRYLEQDGVKYHHILDPKTGKPVENTLASVTILCDNCTWADAFSTALFVMGHDKAVEFWRGRSDFEAVFITKDGEIFATAGCASMLSDCDYQVIYR